MATIPMLPQFYVGRGVDSASGKVYGQAIDFDPPQAVTSGQRTDLRLESVSSSRELTEKLEINATASVTAAWGVSAEFKLTKSREINNYYTYALVRVIVENAPTVLRNPRLRPEARDLLMQKGWEGFTAAYGWEYIDCTITGGSYYALIEIQTNNETQQVDVKTKLSGFYGPFKGDASVMTAFKEISKTTVTNVLVIQSGGSGDPIETTLETMIEQARNFPQLAKNDPVTIAVTTADYRRTVPIPPGLPAPDSLPMMQQRDNLEDLGREYLRLRDYKASAQFVLDHLPECDDFRDLEPVALEEKRIAYKKSREDAAAEIDKIVRQAAKCAEDYNKCQTYVQTIQLLALPRIGGQLMNLKQMEEKLAVLEQELTNLRSGNRSFDAITLAGGQRFYSPGRMHIHGEEHLHLLNKTGVTINKAWGGNGELTVQGNITLEGERFYSPGRMHIHGEEHLYLLNKTGVTISKAWLGSGDLTVEGRLGTGGHSPTPKTPGWGGGIHTWDVEAEGTMWSNGGYESGPRDLAENYFSDLELEPGDVVCLDQDHDTIVRSETANNKLVLGIISTEPGLLLNSPRDVDNNGAGRLFPVALAGCVPCKVSAEKGSIHRGDMLTSSSIPGHAMKAESFTVDGQEFFIPGTILGKALGSLESGTGIIEVFVFLR